MKEKPILFSGPMVRAILDGRKAQTRRIVKPEPRGNEYSGCGPAREYLGLKMAGKWGAYFPDFVPCPYGQPGDRLWVKETHRFDGIDQRIGVREKRIEELSYRADMEGDHSCDDCAWRPSIYMPRWASRITLEVTGVRVERLQEISAPDCDAEGIEKSALHTRDALGRLRRITDYRTLWESINGPGSWDANPWVWVVEFKRIGQ